MKRLLLLLLSSLLLAACQPATPDTTAAADTTAPAVMAPPPAAPARPRYEGTYTVADTTCDLSITITRRDTSYFFACGSVRGPVQVWRNATGPDVGFVFVGLKGIEPEEDISCAWQDSILLIQNYGNSMNEYQRFDCGDKYLALRRQ